MLSVRFEKREQTSTNLKVIIAFVSIVIGIGVGGVAILIAGINPYAVYKSLFLGAFGSGYAFSETLVSATPLILIGAGLALVFRMNLWNIGAYGQYIMGAIFSSYFPLFMSPHMPKVLMLGMMFVAGLFGGAVWAIIPGVLKAYWEVNEVITTLLMNYIALYILKFLMYGPWKNPMSYGFPLSKPFPSSAQLPVLFPHTRVNLGLVFGFLAIVLIWMLIKKTKFGYEIRIIGENIKAARYAGINVGRNIILAMAISGALAGLAGMCQVSGIIHFLQIKINPGYGYTAIIVVWLAYLDPILTGVVGVLLGGLSSGGFSIQISMRVPYGIVGLIESVMLFSLIGAQVFTRYRLRIRRKVGA